MSILDCIFEQNYPNGLKLLCVRKPGAPVVAVQVWYRTGSAAEGPGTRGMAHFLEHMMFRGSANVASEEHARRIADVGGHANAMTTEDVTAFTNCVPVEHLRMVLELEAERMQHLTIDPAVFETERRVIMEEYRAYLDNPVTKAFIEFRRSFFGDHPYAFSPLGTMEDIIAATPERCREFYRTWYRPSNAVVVVVGDLRSEREVAALTAETFGRIAPSAPTPFRQPEMASAAGPRTMKCRVEFDVPMQVHGFVAPSACHQDAVGLNVLMRIAAQGASSRLNRDIVRQRRLAVAAGGSNLFFKHAGMSLMFAAFTPDVSAASVRRCIDDVTGRLRRDGVSQTELDKARNAELAQRTFELYTAEQVCQRLGLAETIEGNYRRWVERMEILQQIARDQLTVLAQRYWNETGQWVLTLLPRRPRISVIVAGLFRRGLRRCGYGARAL